MQNNRWSDTARARFEAFVQMSPQPALVLDPSGCALLWSPAMPAIFGSPTWYEGVPLSDHALPLTGSSWADVLRAIEEPTSLRCMGRTVRGAAQLLMLHIAPVMIEDRLVYTTCVEAREDHSDILFEAVFERAPVGVQLFDAHGQFVRANALNQHIMGLAEDDDGTGYNLFDDPLLTEVDCAVLRRGGTVRRQMWFDFDHVRRHGMWRTLHEGRRYLSATITGLGGASGAMGYVLILQDQTLVQLQREELARLERALGLLDEALIVFDARGIIRRWNEGAERMFGLRRDEAEGHHASLMERADGVPFFDAQAIEAARSGRWEGQLPVRRVDGGRVLAEATLVHAGDSAAGDALFLAVLRDLSARQTQKDQNLRAEQLQLLGQLSEAIAHDFNNILVIILGLATISQREPSLPSATHDALQRIEQAGRRAAELCNQILLYSGRRPQHQQATDVPRTLREMSALLRMTLPPSARLIDELDSPGLPAAYVDPVQLRQIVLNFMTNAADAIEPRGQVRLSARTVTMSAEDLRRCMVSEAATPGRFVSVSVEDNGSGMDAATLERALAPFFSTKGPGRGLGLATVSSMVRGHRGALRCQSTPGQGTTFELLLPVAPQAAPAPEPRPGLDEHSTDVLAGATVLVVDDEESIRWFLRRALRRMGGEVILTPGGEDAISVLQSGQEVDLVVLDLSMPGMSGEEVLAYIQEHHPRLPVILSTGRPPATLSHHLEASPLVLLLSKPYGMRTLQDTIRALLKR